MATVEGVVTENSKEESLSDDNSLLKQMLRGMGITDAGKIIVWQKTIHKAMKERKKMMEITEAISEAQSKQTVANIRAEEAARNLNQLTQEYNLNSHMFGEMDGFLSMDVCNDDYLDRIPDDPRLEEGKRLASEAFADFNQQRNEVERLKQHLHQKITQNYQNLALSFLTSYQDLKNSFSELESSRILLDSEKQELSNIVCDATDYLESKLTKLSIWIRLFKRLDVLKQRLEKQAMSSGIRIVSHGVSAVSSGISVFSTLKSWSAIDWAHFSLFDAAMIGLDLGFGLAHAKAAKDHWDLHSDYRHLSLKLVDYRQELIKKCRAIDVPINSHGLVYLDEDN